MPNSFQHTIYKEYVEMLKSEEKSQANAAEQVMDEVQDQLAPQEDQND